MIINLGFIKTSFCEYLFSKTYKNLAEVTYQDAPVNVTALAFMVGIDSGPIGLILRFDVDAAAYATISNALRRLLSDYIAGKAAQ
jgi:hypothetical protein